MDWAGNSFRTKFSRYWSGSPFDSAHDTNCRQPTTLLTSRLHLNRQTQLAGEVGANQKPKAARFLPAEIVALWGEKRRSSVKKLRRLRVLISLDFQLLLPPISFMETALDCSPAWWCPTMHCWFGLLIFVHLWFA
ncbi:unnamed protein product [Linum tenue]|uniref:Uncharacterized protein n=1 Tax=Linum tenue TaxID=586396 RepID=A0AAV0R733_9ROSI|nr:unnamed protein product [Linum tenue]